jgi:Predicted membrane-associated HD superfamily hydrolase
MLNPAYFVENQSEGMTPHAHLTELESVKVIHQHVIDGISLAHRYKLPTQIQDFIRTHHGTTRTEYFYRTYLAAHPEENAAEVARIFTYPGPRPFSRETAILMMADSIEAASRTLKVFTVESLTQLVEGIVSHQQNALQFDNSNLTLRDIAIAKREFVAKLKNFYHSRIEYPPNPEEEGKQGESTTNH